GTVGEIGGIGQKLPAAQRDGAKLFLVAAANCAEAVRSHYDPGKMRLVKVEKLADAIKDVEAWRDNPGADLPRCTR
ncbi:signaling protein, partial [Nocardioides pocheonensis]